MGHYSVALTLLNQIKSQIPNATIHIQDIFEYAVPNCSQAIYKAFNLLVKKASGFYNQYYKITENRKTDARPAFASYFLYQLDCLIQEHKPTVIISTLPFCSQLVSQYKQKKKSTVPLITCITDISCHSEWINKNTDIYLVATDTVKQGLIAKKVPSERIIVSGIPVKEEFKQRNELETQNKRRLLIMGGGLGLLPTSLSFYEKIDELDGVETTVITGNNQELYQLLSGRFSHIEVIGYTDQVHQYMRQADLILSKAGGITTFEAIFSETPMLVFQPFLQQEKKNASFISNRQIGIVLKTNPQDWLKSIRRVLNSESLRNILKENIKAVKEQTDSKRIMELLFAVETQQRRA